MLVASKHANAADGPASAKKITWTDESYDDVEITSVARAPGILLHVVFCESCYFILLLVLKLTAKLFIGAGSDAYGYLKQKLAKLALAAQPLVFVSSPTSPSCVATCAACCCPQSNCVYLAAACHRRKPPHIQVHSNPGLMDNVDTQIVEGQQLEDPLLHEFVCVPLALLQIKNIIVYLVGCNILTCCADLIIGYC